MQLFVKIRPDTAIDLPINYNHILQGLVYKALANGDPSLSRMIHDGGDSNGERIFKHFTFGPLEGSYRVEDKTITFTDDVFWEFRSYDSNLVEMVERFIKVHGIDLGDAHCTNVETFIGSYEPESNSMYIKARSPIVAYSTDDLRQTYYFTPEEYGFYDLTCLNALKRYKNARPDAEATIQMVPESVCVADKVITTYKGIIIEGWKGEYVLNGDCDILNYLYQTGIGAKNAQGFGMFDVIEEADPLQY